MLTGYQSNMADEECMLSILNPAQTILCAYAGLEITRNYWEITGCPGHPKMVAETQISEQGFRPETQHSSG